MPITTNGQTKSYETALNVEQLLGEIGLDHRKVAVSGAKDPVRMAKKMYADPTSPLVGII